MVNMLFGTKPIAASAPLNVAASAGTSDLDLGSTWLIALFLLLDSIQFTGLRFPIHSLSMMPL